MLKIWSNIFYLNYFSKSKFFYYIGLLFFYHLITLTIIIFGLLDQTYANVKLLTLCSQHSVT